ncbi:peroxide stress protein YaaA [Tropicimonas sp. IMCC34043]|uniref:peroxide stress protein YaaA n=1 Tax=Tropicimonas sp. IMCC34043 TaxID=2248760 RepID=UPI000E259C8B|nr:peroxide stress protein YaaA [Tropicimonas sp. IMCC34043]
MLVVISPAKRLDWSEVPDLTTTRPAFLAEANRLADVARRLSAADLAALMGLSPQLAMLNRDRFAAFSDDPAPEATRPAAFGFAGDTYAGFEARSLDPDEIEWAQSHLRILSGLYGLLRPCDAIQPYRLEMGTRLANPRGATLYAWWGDLLARALTATAADLGCEVLVNCASQEYFAAVPVATLGIRVVTPVFLEDRPGGPKIVSFFAKKARGAMARFVVQNRLTDPAALRDFATGGYGFCADLTEVEDRPVFLRRAVAQDAA